MDEAATEVQRDDLVKSLRETSGRLDKLVRDLVIGFKEYGDPFALRSETQVFAILNENPQS